MFGRFPLKFAPIAATASGDNEIVAAVSGKKIRVISFFMISDTAATVKFRSATTDISGGLPVSANGGVSADSSNGLMETVAGAALNLNLSAVINVGGALSYVEV